MQVAPLPAIGKLPEGGGNPLAIRWLCQQCECRHHGNLLKKTCRIELEKVVANKRPDITGFDKEGHPTFFLEVVHTHPPEAEVQQLARHLQVPIVELRVVGDNDINRVRTSFNMTVLVHGGPCEHDKGLCHDCGQRTCSNHWEPLPHKRCEGGHCLSTLSPSCYCPICKDCDPDGNLHRHCACGVRIIGSYRQCFCCHIGCGVGQQREHRHCKDCRGVITARERYMGIELWYYERCYPCEQKVRSAETPNPL